MFQGFVVQEGTMSLTCLVRDANKMPVNLDALPTYRVYGPGGLMSGGTGTCSVKDAAVPGLYALSIPALGSQGYAAGSCYGVVVSGLLAGVAWAQLHTFCVG